MQNSPPIFLLVALIMGFVGLFLVTFGNGLNHTNHSRRIAISATLPAVIMVVLFYSLALHMHQALGGWPQAYGTQGFPPQLTTHATLATKLFSILLLGGIFVWPLIALLTAIKPTWRRALVYVGVFGVACSICYLCMMLGPAEFVQWWWD